jgi:hypothetical protein
MKRLHLILLLGIALLVLASLVSPGVAWAQGGDPPPDDGDGDDGDDAGDGDTGGIITHIFKLIFPVETMQAATEIMLINILQRNAEGICDLFSGLVADLTLQNPGIKEPSGSWAWMGSDVFAPTWGFTVKIAVALWPATLAIMAALAAKESAIATSWGIADLKQALAQWLGGVLACAFSLEILDLANRLSNAVIVGIIALPIHGVSDASLQTIVNVLLGAALRVFAMGVSPVAAIVAVLVILVLGLALVVSIVGQYFARVALLYILVALAPIVLVIGILRPARWLQWLWVKGVLLVMLLGPINALLFKLALALNTAVTNPILSFLMVVGVISVLLAVNGAIIKGVFGAAAEVIGKAVETASGVIKGAATAGAVVGAAVLTGGAALGVLPAALGAGGAAAAGGGAAAAGTGASAGGGGAATAAAGATAGTAASGATGGGSATSAAGESARAAAASTSLNAPATSPGSSAGGASSAPGSGGGGAESAASAGSDEPSGFLGRLRQRWRGAAPNERAQAIGAGLRAAGGVLGPRSLAGRTAGAVGAGLQFGANQQEELGGRPSPGSSPAQPSGANLAALSPDEIRGYQDAMRDVRRDLRTPMQAAGLDPRQVERDALAPVWAAAQHDTLSNVARQAGFGDRADTASAVGDFMAYRVEGQLMAQGFLSERITRPGAPPSVPLSDSPALLDYDRGQQIAWAVGGGDMGAYAGLHHALRRYGETPAAGAEAAEGFYTTALENQSVAGVIEAARDYGGQAGVPGERLDPWLQQLPPA